MKPNIESFDTFYRTDYGYAIEKTICKAISSRWPSLVAEDVLGLGFSTPFLNMYLGRTQRLISLMPVNQGVKIWPDKKRCLVASTEELLLPLDNNSFDRVLAVHTLESSDNCEALLNEIWRVLRPNGRVLAIVPNRLGILSKWKNTPFESGQKYTMNELISLLSINNFSILQKETEFLLPASPYSLNLKVIQAASQLGRNFIKPFGGLLIVEAKKIVSQNKTIALQIKHKQILPKHSRIATTS
jgi:SAM-dependent methyltransferase